MISTRQFTREYCSTSSISLQAISLLFSVFLNYCFKLLIISSIIFDCSSFSRRSLDFLWQFSTDFRSSVSKCFICFLDSARISPSIFIISSFFMPVFPVSTLVSNYHVLLSCSLQCPDIVIGLQTFHIFLGHINTCWVKAIFANIAQYLQCSHTNVATTLFTLFSTLMRHFALLT